MNCKRTGYFCIFRLLRLAEKSYVGCGSKQLADVLAMSQPVVLGERASAECVLMSVRHTTSESLHKSGARLLVSTANEVKALPLYRPLRAVTGHCSWPLSKNSQRSRPLLLYTMTRAVIYLEDGLR